MKEIKLTQGQVALVDDEDYEYLNQFKWYAMFKGGRFYAARRSEGKTMLMHRVIMDHPEGSVDHIDGNGVDNQKNNLQACTNQENLCNRGPTKVNKSGYKGVCWQNNKWLAQIQHNQKNRYLGLFSDKIEAAQAYDKVARELHGEFCYQNLTNESGVV